MSYILACVFYCFPQTFISGEIKGAFPRDNYIVSGNLSVKFGDTLVFEAGSELRFKPNTGLTIRGVFIANGKIDNPIILTSAQEQDVKLSNSNPQKMFWWKGVDLSASKVMSRLSYCLFCFSDTALAIKNSFQKIDLDHVVFHKSKSANLVWAGKTVEINDDVQYIYRMDFKVNPPKKESFPVKVASDFAYGFKSRWKIIIKPTCAVVALSGAGIWAFGYTKAEDYNKKYMLETNKEGAKDMRMKRDRMVDLVNTGIAMSMIGTGAFFITFLF
jgi:hypothetical protein